MECLKYLSKELKETCRLTTSETQQLDEVISILINYNNKEDSLSEIVSKMVFRKINYPIWHENWIEKQNLFDFLIMNYQLDLIEKLDEFKLLKD